MIDQKQTELKKYQTEIATLTDLSKKLKLAMDDMNQSLSSYKTKHIISTEFVPKNLASVNSVLERFFTHHVIKDINDLVLHHRGLISKAIEHAKNPSEHDNRAEYRQTVRDLNTIKNNLIEYDNLEKEMSIADIKYYRGGFIEYINRAAKISKFISAYEKIVSYTKGSGLNIDDLPSSSEIKSSLLAIAAPQEADEFTDYSGTSHKEQDDNTIKDGEKIGLGSEKSLRMMNRNMFDQVITAITAEKYKCFQDVLAKLLEYNECAISSKDGTNLDLKCQALKEEHEIGKANCKSHYPMVTITDKAIEESLEKAEQISMVSQEGSLMLDYSVLQDGTQNFVAAGEFISKTAAVPMLNAPVYDDNFTSSFTEALGNNSFPAYLNQLLIGTSNETKANEEL